MWLPSLLNMIKSSLRNKALYLYIIKEVKLIYNSALHLRDIQKSNQSIQ